MDSNNEYTHRSFFETKEKTVPLTEFLKGVAYFDALMEHKINELLNTKPIIK